MNMKKQIHGGDVYRHSYAIDFSSNINPLGTPESVIRAGMESMKKIGHYPDIRYQELGQALERYEGVPYEWIICGNGAAELIFSLVWAIRPERSLIPVPTFAEYEIALEAAGCKVDHYLMTQEFRLDRGILDAITPAHDILFLCSPNNPTGFLIEPDFLLDIQEHCRKCEVFLVVDECFQDFIQEPLRYTMVEHLKEYQNLFLLKAFTKRYAMAGIRLGYGLCANMELLDRMNQVTQPWNVSVPAQMAGAAALTETAYVDEARQLVQKERMYLKEQMGRFPLKIYDSKANYIFFKGPKKLYEDCLARGILIRDCSNYPGLEAGFYRIAVRTHKENEELIRMFHKIFER